MAAASPSCLQVGLCEQLLSHLSKYQHQEKDAPSTSSKEMPLAAKPFEGMKAVKKQDSEGGFEGMALSFCDLPCTPVGESC